MPTDTAPATSVLPAKSVALCAGCADNCYNGKLAQRCWSFEGAHVVERVPVGKWDDPPYIWKPVVVLDCRHTREVAFLKREDVRVVANKEEAQRWR